jgi:hypothetical protein
MGIGDIFINFNDFIIPARSGDEDIDVIKKIKKL